MKKPVTGLTLLVLLGIAVLFLQKVNQAKQQRARAAEAEQKLAETEADARRQEQKTRRLEDKLLETQLEATARAAEAHELKRQLASTPKPEKAPELNPGAKLLKDPQMKATLKKQQVENVERMANKVVNAGLIKQLNLNADQAGYLKELLKKKYGPGADISIELMAGELTDAQLTELGKQFKQQIAEADSQIKGYLGDDAYKIFEWQEKSQEDRSRVKDFQKKLSGLGQSSLGPEQEDGLLRAIYEERQNFKFQVDYRDPLNYDYEHLREFFSEENLNIFFHDMERLNENILLRVQALLTPEQSAAFQTLQQDQLEKGKVVVRMTNALFGRRAATSAE
jgi:hypothetical protein